MYSIVFTKKAEKELDKLPAKIADQIADEIEKLATEPRPHGYKNSRIFEYLTPPPIYTESELAIIGLSILSKIQF